MIEKDIDALDLALALYSTPHQSYALEDRPLASGTLELIRIVAGDEVAIANAQTRSAKPRNTVMDAAVLYIQQALFHDAADSYRLLGVSSVAREETIKEHYRWLMRWLHPDRNPDRWVVAYSERVNRAWNSLSSPDRRHNYDQQIRDAALRSEIVASRQHAHVRVRHSGSRATPGVGPSRFMRRLPNFVLGGLSVVCAIGLYLFHIQQSSEREASLVLAKRIAMEGPVGETSAQEEAIRHQIEFEEHVIELSQPVVPVSSGKPGPVAPVEAGRPQAEVARNASLELDSKATNRIAARAVKSPSTPAPSTLSPSVPAVVSLPDAKAMARSALVEAATIAVPSVQAAPSPVSAAAPVMRSSPMLPNSPPVATAAMSSVAGISTRVVASTNGSGGEPLSEPTEQASAPAMLPVSAMSPQEATKFVPRAFSDAYAKGDLAQMMRLFAPDAVNDRGGIDAISMDYDHLFRDSGKRNLQLIDLSWAIQPDRIAGSGSFVAQIEHGGVPATQVRGWIQIEAILLNGHWKIHRLLHGNSQ